MGARLTPSSRKSKQTISGRRAFCAVVRCKPLLPERLREFRRFDGDLAVFLTVPVASLKLQLGLSNAIAKLGVLRRERPLVDLLKQTQVEEAVVISREDFISGLMTPKNAPLCRDFLAIDVPIADTIAELLRNSDLAGVDSMPMQKLTGPAGGRPPAYFTSSTSTTILAILPVKRVSFRPMPMPSTTGV
jgi:hypothetical protein